MADEIRHLALIWDCDVDLDAEDYQRWQRTGVEFDFSNGFLLRDQSNLDARQVDGEIRAIVNHSDWQKVLELQIEMLGSDVSSNDISVIKRRLIHLQSLCMQDHGKWFGVFKSGKLVADLGIFLCGDVARFQHVETRDNHRGHGYCRALICAAMNWVMTQSSSYQIWIEAEENSDAAMIYQRFGFQKQERLLAAFHADISQF
ncbi:GNAT family N-acetyltransferase [Maritalea mobilis]|nr:GNAT family N-acetyltransferase [Maritalea mobilis]